MALTPAQRELVRIAARTSDPERRRGLLMRLVDALPRTPLVRGAGEKVLARSLDQFSRGGEVPMTPFAKRMVRLAYATTDKVLRQGILESVRVAAYPKEFLEAVKQQKFRNPVTNNQVKFVSLPGTMQTQIYEQWRQKNQPPTGLENVQVPQEVLTEARETIYGHLPQAVSSMEEAMKLQEQGKPWRTTMIAKGAKGGMKFWEASSDGKTILARWGPMGPAGDWKQSKEMKSVKDAFKRRDSKEKKGYMSAGFNIAMAVTDGPVGLTTDGVWAQLEEKFGSDPEKMGQAVKGALASLTQLDAWNPGGWDSVHDTANGLVQKWKEHQAGADSSTAEVLKEAPKPKKDKPKPKKTKAPEMVDMTADVMDFLKQMGTSPSKLPDLDSGLVSLVSEWEGSDADFDKIDELGKEVFGNNFDDTRRVEMMRAVADGLENQVKQAEAEGNKEHAANLEEMIGIARKRADFLEHDVKTKKKKKTQAPPMVDMTGDVMEKLKQIGEEFDEKGEAAKKKLEKAKAKPKPKKTEAPKPEKTEAPKGKHKDRKELRAKPKKKMADSVKVSDELSGILIPDSMSDAKKAQAKQQLKSANFQLLSTLRENAQHALDSPGGAYAKALKKAGYTPEGIRDMHTALSKALVPALGKKYHPDVLQVANLHDLESEDADQLAAFKGDKPARGKKLTPQELFNKFMAKAKPETKERMQGMPLNDFMAMYAAIMSEEDEGFDAPGKTAGRLPQEPHSVVQDAFEEGVLAMDDTVNDILAGEDEDAGGITIFDSPEEARTAKLSDEDRQIVRLAHSTGNVNLRRRLLAMFRAS